MYSNKGCVSSKPSMFYLPPPPSTPITLLTRHRKRTVPDPWNCFEVDAAMSVEPTSIDRPVAGRCQHTT